MIGQSSLTGRAKAALVFGSGAEARAVIVTIVVQSRVRGSGDRVRFTGRGTFEDQTARHILDTVLPTVDRICSGVGLRRRRFEISAANTAATAAADLGMAISGFSADVAILAAMLSAALGVPVPQDVVFTGHLASVEGQFALVRGIPAKLAAAESDESIRVFIYPTFRTDGSLRALSPGELQRASEAVSSFSGNIRLTAVGNVAELAPHVFSDEAVVLAGLRRGFFGLSWETTDERDGVEQTREFLLKSNDSRFWAVLERRLLSGDNDRARALLTARMRYHARRRAYPSGLGGRLGQLIGSLPSSTRRLKVKFPLLGMKDCIRFGQFAGKGDHEDVRLLIDAAQGRSPESQTPVMALRAERSVKGLRPESAAFETVVSEISADTVARKIGLPIDTARASYHMDRVTAETYDEFNEAVSSYYLHLLRHTRSIGAGVEPHVVSAEALDLLERTFAKDGGQAAALAEARDGMHGGLRFVLDALTERFKTEQQVKHVQWVLKEALDSADWPARVAFTAALLERLAPHLPADVRAKPPERLAKHYDLIARAYVRSIDTVRALLRAL